MNRFRPLILTAVIIFTAFLAYGLWTVPSPQPADAPGFSAERVVKDIEVISREHHSVAHPQERAEVREYLISRLEGLGADTVMTFEYDSLRDPRNRPYIGVFDAVNLVADFAPLQASEDTTWLMMVAHYDSRFAQAMPKDTVWSYGAADDGYGVSVILETVSQALKQREHWKQGLKVLFTDAEEVLMMGMTTMWENDRQAFDNVGLMINLEARGPWGPCLLFETSAGNEKVMDLYADAARYPFTYSLTTVVYEFMPNFTDFTIVKDEIPGMNFSTIADINHYHTDLDNFSNVSPKSLQHYGAQVLPVVMEYLTDAKYADKDYFRSDKDTVNFTVPALGLFNFSKTWWMIINIIVYVFFVLLFMLEVVRGRLKVGKAFRNTAIVLLAGILVLASGELVAYICSTIAGADFEAFGIIGGIPFDNAAMIVSMVVIAASVVAVYCVGRAKAVRQVAGSMRKNAAANAAAHHAYENLYGTLFLMFVLSLVLVIALGENLMFFIPLFCAVAAMILYHLTSLKFWLVASIVVILLHALSFLYALTMALTIGAFGAVAMLAFFDIMVLIPLADLYLLNTGKKK
ncbi:MAG: M28 family peptidase [Bacteroidales bacterium]|nr:M28 family peptidase [Bacteroidales bacterium]